MDAYCRTLSPDGVGDLVCPHGTETMFARYGFNKNGQKPAWRCYADVLSTSNAAACTTNDGELTNVGCSDPDPSALKYCNRPDDLAAILNDGCVTEFKELSENIPQDTTTCSELAKSKIVGGIDGTVGSWTWMVRVEITDPDVDVHTCGGTIIDDFWVLTCKY